MSKAKPAPLPAGTVVGGYQIIKRIAAGGFGVVYLAEDAGRHMVAIKEYLPSSLAERAQGELTPRVKPEKQPLYRLGLKSFFEEGRSLAQISHPSVVSVLNFFRENETVSAYCKKTQPFTGIAHLFSNNRFTAGYAAG